MEHRNYSPQFVVCSRKTCVRSMAEAVPKPPVPPPEAVLVNTKGFESTPRDHFEPVKLHFAINHDNLEEAQQQIQRGINLDFVVHGNTPLMLAMLREQYDIAMLLVQAGADVTIPEIYAWRRQPIHLAARDGQSTLVQALLNHGACIQAADGMAMTPLHWAAAHGHEETVKVLVDNGAHIHVKDDRGRTPLFRAIASSHIAVVQTLCQEGASVNTQDIYGWSPLHQASLCSLPIVPDLLALGARPNLQDFRGDTPLHLVVSRQAHHNLITLSRTDLQFYTRDLKITSTCTDRLKNFISDRDLLLALLDYGCDVNMLNGEGKSPLDLAIANSNLIFVKWLVCADAKLSSQMNSYPAGWPVGLALNAGLQELLANTRDVRVQSLKDIARSSVRSHIYPVISHKIELLPIPPLLKQFLHIDLQMH